MRLRAYLVGLIVCTLVPVVSFAAILVVLLTRQERAAFQRGLQDTARALSLAVERELEHSIGTLEALAGSEHAEAGDLRTFSRAAARVLATQARWYTVTLLDPAGRSVVALLPPIGPSREVADQAWFQAVLESRRPVVSGLVNEGAAGTSGIVVAVPVVRGNALRHVLVARLDPGRLGDVLAKQRIPPDWTAAILDQEGIIVARNRAAEQFVGQPATPDLRAKVRNFLEASYLATNKEGDAVYAAFTRSTFSGWTVALGVPAAVVEATFHQFLATVVTGGLVVVAMGTGLALFFARRIAWPIRRLAAGAQAWGRGAPLRPVPSAKLEEVDVLVRVVAQAAAEREHTEELLRRTNDTLNAVVDASPAAIIGIDRDLRVVMWNPAAGRLFGWSAEEVMGQPLRTVPEELREAFRASCEAVLAGASLAGQEACRCRKDGSRVDVSVSTGPLRDGRGAITGVLEVIADITEFKRGEAERGRLLQRERAARGEAEATAERLRRVQAVTDAALVRLRVDELSRELLRRICGALDADTATVLLLDDDETHLVVRASVGLREEVVEAIRGRVGQGFSGTIALTRQPLIAEDTSKVELASLFLRTHIRSLMGVPLVLEDRLIGVVHVGTTRPRRFSQDDVYLLQLVADRLALVIHHAALYERERQARAEAERSNRAKDEYVAILGHELRNPLAAIASAVMALEQHHGIGAEGRAELQAIIARQTRHITRLVDDLLDVARLTSGRFSLDRQCVDLCAVAARCIASFREAGRTAAHDVSLHGEPVIVDGDPTRLEQVVENLLVNAIRYTASGGRIEVEVERAEAEAVLRVRDTGVGIAPDMLERIFEPFVQGHQSLERAAGGIGIGLSLVRHLVELHGGRVTAASAGVGQGSEFTLRLPAAAAPAATPLVPGGASGPRPRRGFHVLIVEDNDDVRTGLRLLLETLGHRVTEAADGPGGLAAILAERPRVALVDVGLPGLDGYALAERVRSRPDGDAVALIALTGYGRVEDRHRAEAAGFDDHLVKPVDLDRLTEALTRVGGEAPAAR